MSPLLFFKNNAKTLFSATVERKAQYLVKSSCVFLIILYNIKQWAYCARRGEPMILSNAFDYVNVMDRAADASNLRLTMIANNLANVDTPTYKRQDIEFEDVLKRKLLQAGYRTLEDAVKNVNVGSLNGIQYTDHGSFSYRIDKNNVDPDTENVELASEQIRYQAIISEITHDMTRLKAVIK